MTSIKIKTLYFTCLPIQDSSVQFILYRRCKWPLPSRLVPTHPKRTTSRLHQRFFELQGAQKIRGGVPHQLAEPRHSVKWGSGECPPHGRYFCVFASKIFAVTQGSNRSSTVHGFGSIPPSFEHSHHSFSAPALPAYSNFLFVVCWRVSAHRFFVTFHSCVNLNCNSTPSSTVATLSDSYRLSLQFLWVSLLMMKSGWVSFVNFNGCRLQNFAR